MSFLKVDIAEFKAHWTGLLAAYPELSDDEELRADMLEAETEFQVIASRLVRRMLDARETKVGAKARKSDISERLARYERQEAGYVTLLKALMLAADVQKITLPEATVSITKPRTKVNITDLEALPQGFFKRLERTSEIKAALEAGDEVPGAELALGEDGLMVRTK